LTIVAGKFLQKFSCYNRQNRCKKQARRDDENEKALARAKKFDFSPASCYSGETVIQERA
jgi:hypothetical protein